MYETIEEGIEGLANNPFTKTIKYTYLIFSKNKFKDILFQMQDIDLPYPKRLPN